MECLFKNLDWPVPRFTRQHEQAYRAVTACSCVIMGGHHEILETIPIEITTREQLKFLNTPTAL